MTCPLADFAFDYRLGVGAFAQVPTEAGFERVRVADVHDARRLIDGCTGSDGSGRALRGLLGAGAPMEQLHRLSDDAVRDRVAGLVARRAVTVWRRPRLAGAGAGEGAPVDGVADADVADAPALARPAPRPPTAPGLPSCRDAWAAVDAETAAVLAHGGDDRPITRNRHISAAYARLYERQPSLTWGGLAAIVSRQAGCAMGDAAEIVNGRWGWAGGDDARVAYDALADTNELIFEDIYPPMRFYEQHGLAGIERCGDARPPGKAVPPSLKQALRQIDSGTAAGARAGADQIARYEQIDIVQERIYSDPEVRKTFERNQWWARRPAGRMAGAQKPEIALSSTCEGARVPFRGDIGVAADRVAYYETLMNRFERQGATWQQQTMREIAGLVR